MTAVLAYLRSLSVAEWIGIAAASWLILSVLGSVSMARAAHVLKRRAKPATEPRFVAPVDEADTRWLPFLPPVPPSDRLVIPDFYVASDWAERRAS